MLVRPERPDDFPAIRTLVEAAFGGPEEADLVEALRASDSYVPDLALVADDDGEVVGHIVFSYVDLVGDHPRRVLSLAPMAVWPDRQRTGIGTALVRAGIALAEGLNEPLVVVVGHPTYYPRFGFELARPLGLESSIPGLPDDAFMVRRLHAYDPRCRGHIVYPPAFDQT